MFPYFRAIPRIVSLVALVGTTTKKTARGTKEMDEMKGVRERNGKRENKEWAEHRMPMQLRGFEPKCIRLYAAR